MDWEEFKIAGMKEAAASLLRACRFLVLIAVGSCPDANSPALGQGCIAVRGGGQCSLSGHLALEHDDNYLNADDWQVSLNIAGFIPTAPSSATRSLRFQKSVAPRRSTTPIT